jgi:hypothetical protein
MSKINSQSGFIGTASKGQVRINSKWISALVVLALLLGGWPARADEPDDQYMQVYNLIQQADDLTAHGKPTPAKAKYQEAQTALTAFQKEHPDWNPKLVTYRLNYVVGKLAALTQKPRGRCRAAQGAAPASHRRRQADAGHDCEDGHGDKSRRRGCPGDEVARDQDDCERDSEGDFREWGHHLRAGHG